MPDNVKFSIILPCYNVSKYIRRGLDSIIKQTLQDWEAVLVDDGSTDDTGRLCDEYAEKDSRFHVIHTENRGVSAARNTGIDVAKGELLYFMDPDDWAEPTCLERCYDTFLKQDCDIVHFSTWWWRGKRRARERFANETFEGCKILREFAGPMSGISQCGLDCFYKGENIWRHKATWTIWGFAYKREFIVGNGIAFPKGIRMFEDVLFAIEATIKARKIVRIPDTLYNYDVKLNGAARSKKNNQRLFEDKYNLIPFRQRLREMIKDFDLHDYYIGSHILSCLQLALQLSNNLRDYSLFKKYVSHPKIRESIKKVSIEGAPWKFAIPVRLLKMGNTFLLFGGCWLMHKTGMVRRISF